MQTRITFKTLLAFLALISLFTSSMAMAQIARPEMYVQYLGAISAWDTDSDNEYEDELLITEVNLPWGDAEIYSKLEYLRNEDGEGNDKTVFELGALVPLTELPGVGEVKGFMANTFFVLQLEQEDQQGDAPEDYILYGVGYEHDTDLLDEFSTQILIKEAIGEQDRIRISVNWLDQVTKSSYGLYFQGFLDVESNTKDSDFTIESRIQIMADIGEAYLGKEELFIGFGMDIQENTEDDYRQATPQLFVQFVF